MSDVKRQQWWHAYGGVHADGYYMLVVAGPTDKGPDDANGKGIPMRDIYSGGKIKDAELKYLTSLDHEPTDLEKDHLQPEEFWQWDEHGNEIPWNED